MAEYALAWRPWRRLSVKAIRVLWLVCLALTPVALVLQDLTTLRAGSIRLGSLIVFLWIVLAWLWPVRHLRSPILALTAALAFGVQVVTSLALGDDLLVSARVAAATVVQALVILAFYRWRIGDDNLTPHRPSDIVDLMLASIVGALVVLPLGPAPGLWLTSSTFELVRWTTLSAGYVFVGSACIMLLVQRAHLAGEVVRQRQEALDQAGLLGTVFESINEALVLMDPEGVVQRHNAAAVKILSRERLTSEPARWLRRMAERPSFTYTFNRDGSEEGLRILAVQLAPVQYVGSDSIVAIVRDVTTEQRRIEELASFAAVAAHDLKSPLAAVQGWMEVAEDALAVDPKTAIEALRRGRHSTDRMSREIDDWLTYNVAREGVVQPEAIALQPRLDALAAGYPGVDFVIRTPDTVLVDPTLLRHLLANLIDNSVKYTQPGERPSITVHSSGGDPGWVRLYVVDAGIGIPEGEETAVFEPFRRASTVAGYEGSGLGLALCKRIVRRHGGLITAQRNEGPGTTITVTLPQGG